MEALKWCGIKVDEGIREGWKYGPYSQSDRKDLYRQYADMLVDKGDAYYAFDTPGKLESRKNESKKAGETFIYNADVRNNLNNSVSLRKVNGVKRLKKGNPLSSVTGCLTMKIFILMILSGGI